MATERTKARRPRNTGNLKKERPGLWVARLFSGERYPPTERNPYGAPKLKEIRIPADTQADAEAALRKLLKQQDDGVVGEPTKETVAQYLRRWHAGKEFPKVRTESDFRKLIEEYIIPVLGHIKINELQARQIKPFLADVASKGKPNAKPRKGIARAAGSPKWAKYCFEVLRNAINDGLAPDPPELTRNPLKGVPVPKYKPGKDVIHALSERQVTRFLAAVADTPHATLFNFWLATGLRPGEMRGLKWADLRDDYRTVKLRQAVEEADGKVSIGTDLKTEDSRRTIPLPPSIADMLRAHRVQQNAGRLKAGPAWQDNDLVFPNEQGGILNEGNLGRRYLKPNIAKLDGMRPDDAKAFRLYDLRHTHATLLLQRGENIVTVSKRLGHSTVTLTLNTYGHCLQEHQEHATATIAGILWGEAAS
jgi:integrase